MVFRFASFIISGAAVRVKQTGHTLNRKSRQHIFRCIAGFLNQVLRTFILLTRRLYRVAYQLTLK